MNQTESAGAMGAVDAQFSKTKVLKPFPGFEQTYQGAPGTTPIVFPGTLDPRAGAPGYDPKLMAGIPMPVGARAYFWIPYCPNPEGGFQTYTYRFVYRYRNLRDYRVPGSADIPRPPYHIPSQTPGAPDNTVVPAAPRTVIPASWSSILFIQAEVASANGRSNLRVEEIVVPDSSLINLVRPLLPDGTEGVVQQGILDPATNPIAAPVPLFTEFWTDAGGDELLVYVVRSDPAADWDFTGTDLGFSNIYGTGNGTHAVFPESGVYMVTGTNP